MIKIKRFLEEEAARLGLVETSTSVSGDNVTYYINVSKEVMFKTVHICFRISTKHLHKNKYFINVQTMQQAEEGINHFRNLIKLWEAKNV
jgi:hypothetical protein